jgi:hypothetical protein
MNIIFSNKDKHSNQSNISNNSKFNKRHWQINKWAWRTVTWISYILLKITFNYMYKTLQTLATGKTVFLFIIKAFK